jgi:hypothetical protein
MNAVAKKETSDELFDHYSTQCSLFISFRLFAGLYAHQPREVYFQAVADLMKEFESHAKTAVQKRCNEMQVNVRPGQENVAIQRYRIEQNEIIARTVEFCKARLVSLCVSPENPPAPQETLEQMITRICKEQIEASKRVVPNAEEKTT